MLNLFSYIISLLLVASILQRSDATHDDGVARECRRPDNQIGSCVPLNECEWYKYTYTQLNIFDIGDFWRKYQCDENYLYICCLTNTTSGITQPVRTLSDAREVNNGGGKSSIPNCRLADNRSGSCVRLNECGSLKYEHDRRVDHKDFWNKYQCGSSRNYVCCVNGTMASSQNEVKSVKNTPPKPRVFENCGAKSVGPRIMGGNSAEFKEFPWLVGIERWESKCDPVVYCGGSLINVLYVLTAAHCVTDEMDKKITVRLGDYNLETNPDCNEYGDCNPKFVRRNIAETIVHGKHNRATRHHDIALLRMDKMVKLNQFVKPICLPKNITPLDMPMNLTVIGWGSKVVSSIENSAKIMKVDVPLTNKSVCKRAFNEKYLLASMICAGGIRGEDSCTGDSGGPIMRGGHFWTLEGVVSYGKPCGHAGYPSIYTDVRYYLSWIQENVENLS